MWRSPISIFGTIAPPGGLAGSRWRLSSLLIFVGQNQRLSLTAGQSLAQILVSVIMIGLVKNEIFIFISVA